MPTDRKRTKWVQGGIVGEPVHQEIVSGLNELLDVDDGPWKFGFPSDTDIDDVGRLGWGGTLCRVCGDTWFHHARWKCTRRKRS